MRNRLLARAGSSLSETRSSPTGRPNVASTHERSRLGRSLRLFTRASACTVHVTLQKGSVTRCRSRGHESLFEAVEERRADLERDRSDDRRIGALQCFHVARNLDAPHFSAKRFGRGPQPPFGDDTIRVDVVVKRGPARTARKVIHSPLRT
jgi:hypothetical protein